MTPWSRWLLHQRIMQHLVTQQNVSGSVRIWHNSLAYVQVLTEIAGETLEQMAAAPKNKAAPARAAAVAQEQEEADAEADDLQARLDAIRS